MFILKKMVISASKKIMSKVYFFFRIGGEGHPIRSPTISDSILDACFEQDPKSRVACEIDGEEQLCVFAGEITTKAKLDYESIVRQAIVKSAM